MNNNLVMKYLKCTKLQCSGKYKSVAFQLAVQKKQIELHMHDIVHALLYSFCWPSFISQVVYIVSLHEPGESLKRTRLKELE